MVIFNKKKWVAQYLDDLRKDPWNHKKKYLKLPFNIKVKDVVKRTPIETMEQYQMPEELTNYVTIPYVIFTKNTSGDYCSFIWGTRGETCNYAESSDLKEGFTQYIECMFYISNLAAMLSW